MCPSPSQYISVLIQSGIHTIFALNWNDKVNISVQLHIQIHRWHIVNQWPRVWKLSWSDVSRWALDQRHDGEQHLCFLLGFTPFDREGRSAAHFPLRLTWRFGLNSIYWKSIKTYILNKQIRFRIEQQDKNILYSALSQEMHKITNTL